MTPAAIKTKGPAMRVVCLMTAEAISGRGALLFLLPNLFLMTGPARKALVRAVKFILRLRFVVKRP